ncbi:aspartate aminotransferase family protein [Endozoicomonas numazuensis]|uniref:4-aminobutyrate aminotransferase n=1 Tax=Endozoicomonas numazuensis TaxID=1137799 RepID=A0A081N6G9_9GAMM|nr:aspartate aminotransferase family protein [Endozoicomonas numazuensis]KEQ14042.1 4-aminobutyrate aminotransferase [Endozoicomonas numazuensis]
MDGVTGFLHSEGDINTTEERTRWQNQLAHPRTEAMLEEDARYFLHQSMSTPCLDVLEKADGIYIEDARGHRYMDFHGNNVHQLGYGHPQVVESIKKQLDTLPFSPRRFTHQVAIDCARKLGNICGGDLNRVLFAPGGTAVIGMALKLARVVTGNHKIISLWDSFHGASLDAIGVGGEACFRESMGPLMPGVERIPPAVSYRGIWPREDGSDVHYADYLEYVIEKEGGVGAFIAETVRNTDVQIPSQAYWQRVREICDTHNVLLIMDEIPNGMGRSGEWFTYQRFGITPDILCIGKGLGGGIIPMAAMITRDEFNVAQHISLGHYTHEKSPVGCAAALATIEAIEQDHLLDKVRADEPYVRNRLENMKSRYELMGDIRGIGLLWGVELVTCRQSKERATREAEKILYRCLELGLSFKVSQGNVLQLSPPLTIDRNELMRALDIVELAISEISAA